MEVHHHAHTGTDSHRGHRKKWTHYFWEFLMSFLAVFCGFVAEYQLEHKIEKERVNKYMHDMVENLKYDTTRVARNMTENIRLHRDMDSFRFEIKEAINKRPNNARLYYFFVTVNQYGIAAFNRSAITQLKNSGSLRLVKNDSLLNEILDYYERKVVGSEYYEQQVKMGLESLGATYKRVFSTQPFNFVATMNDTTFNYGISSNDKQSMMSDLNAKPLQLLTNDPKELEMLLSDVFNFEWRIINYDRFLRYTRQAADKLMQDIRNKY